MCGLVICLGRIGIRKKLTSSRVAPILYPCPDGQGHLRERLDMTYQEAKAAANKKAPNVTFTGDAGNGHTFEVYYCPRRKRQVWTTITPQGLRII